MAHELDTTTGRAAIAFRGATPWHGLGEIIQPNDDLDTIRYKAGLEYNVEGKPVRYETEHINEQAQWCNTLRSMPSHQVLYRSDTFTPLSVVSNKYQIVQPKEVIDFYQNLVRDYGFEIEVVGALRGGRKVWALANTNEAFNLNNEDKVKGYLLLATSYDGTMATQARFTSIRVVCNNTLSMARSDGKPNVSIPHSTRFNADSVQRALNIGPVWSKFAYFADYAAKRQITNEEAGDLVVQTYFGVSKDEIPKFIRKQENRPKVEKLFNRIVDLAATSPGAYMKSANGTLWGLLNAITYDIDFSPGRNRTPDVQLDRAWFGQGEQIKQRAMVLAEELL